MKQVFAFEVGGRLYGVAPEGVDSVGGRPERATAVPSAPPHILGVINDRGRALGLFDLALFLGHEASEPRRLVVLSAGELRAGVPAASVRGLIECPPLEAAADDQAYALGVGLVGGRPLTVLDVGGLLRAASCG